MCKDIQRASHMSTSTPLELPMQKTCSMAAQPNQEKNIKVNHSLRLLILISRAIRFNYTARKTGSRTSNNLSGQVTPCLSIPVIHSLVVSRKLVTSCLSHRSQVASRMPVTSCHSYRCWVLRPLVDRYLIHQFYPCPLDPQCKVTPTCFHLLELCPREDIHNQPPAEQDKLNNPTLSQDKPEIINVRKTTVVEVFEGLELTLEQLVSELKPE